MQIPRPSDADKERFRSVVPSDPRVEIKPMFGNLGAFVNGNMFMGLYGSQIGVKLPAVEAESLSRTEGAGPFGPPERPMGGYLAIPASLIGTQEGARWAGLALEHVATFPAKAAKTG